MNITTKSKYAVRALVELARRNPDAPVPLMLIAEARGIPGQFLEQLFASLRRAGLLQSFRGVHGGFSFNRPPDQITVLDVVEILDGPIEPALCTTEDTCRRRPICSVGDVWVQAKLSVEEVLSGVTIQDLAERESSLTGTMYYI
jgi:Rrf2 family protein